MHAKDEKNNAIYIDDDDKEEEQRKEKQRVSQEWKLQSWVNLEYSTRLIIFQLAPLICVHILKIKFCSL